MRIAKARGVGVAARFLLTVLLVGAAVGVVWKVGVMLVHAL